MGGTRTLLLAPNLPPHRLHINVDPSIVDAALHVVQYPDILTAQKVRPVAGTHRYSVNGVAAQLRSTLLFRAGRNLRVSCGSPALTVGLKQADSSC